MTLLNYAIDYANRVGASPGYAEQLTVLCRRLPWTPADLTVAKIDAYLSRALGHLAASTVHNHRRMLNTLRKAALEDGLVVDECTRPIRKVKYELPLVRAWTHAEMRQLLAVASEMPGGTLRCPYKLLLPAWILVGYSSGLRLGDLLSIQHAQLRGNRLALVLRKTRQPHVVVLDEMAIHAIAQLPKCGPKIFGSLIGRSQILRTLRRLVKRARLEGTGKYLRRASATYAQLSGMDAQAQLGHLTPSMKARYLDMVLLADNRRPVPSIN